LKLRKVFRFRMNPDAAQREQLARMAGAPPLGLELGARGEAKAHRETGNTLPQSRNLGCPIARVVRIQEYSRAPVEANMEWRYGNT
jgi:hypothetical protein